MARPTKYDPERAKRIVEALRTGNTRRAACAYGGISDETFANWLKRYLDFLDQVKLAEAECEVQNVAILKKAAAGYKTQSKRTKNKTRTEVVRKANGEPLTDKAGNPMTVEITDTETIIVEGYEFDWRAALEWLKRRRRAEWGDSIDIRKLDDETLIALLERDAAQRSGAPALGAPPALPPGRDE